MKIKSLHIKNFKSIVDLTINEPNPFTVFVGPNGSGKSNIFEALEFINLQSKLKDNYSLDGLFGGSENFLNSPILPFFFKCQFEANKFGSIVYRSFNKKTLEEHNLFLKSLDPYFQISQHEEIPLDKPYNTTNIQNSIIDEDEKFKQSKPEIESRLQFFNQFSRIFINSKKDNRQNLNDDRKLNSNTSNLEKVIKRLLENKEKREEISEWLELFLPEFDRIEVQKSEFSSNENLLIYQKHYERPFNKELISDGTYNIIALLTAVYQSDEPQFLCIEEPENGLHPKVIKQLVNFFRNACEEKGHYIWLNTHSQTLVSVLEPKEIVLVDKFNGETQIKQFGKDFNLHGFEMDEAWLSNALGGGLPW